MGDAISKHKPPDVPWRVLQAEIASLNQPSLSEVDVFLRSSQSTHDGQHFVEDEYLEKRYTRCSKKHEHHKFFLVKDLTLDDLETAGVADSARCQFTLDHVKREAVQTVRLGVNYTAKYRPEKFGVKTLRGTTHCRSGTGKVDPARSRADVPRGFNPGTTFYITTACHVVYNDDEAAKTVVWFFFYDDHDRSGVVKARGVRLVQRNTVADTSQLLCVMDDVQAALGVWRRLEEASTPDPVLPWNYRISYCISCPHGAALRASFGSLNIVRTGNAAPLSLDLFKLVYSRIPAHYCHIEERKVFYFMWNFILSSELMDYVEHQSGRVKEILQYVEDRHLVVRPSDGETAILQEVLDTLMLHVKGDLFMELCISRGLSLDEVKHIVQEDDLQLERLTQKMTRRKAKGVVMDDGFRERFQKLSDAIHAKKDALEHGFDVIDPDSLISIRTMTYSIPTCPGSSGAAVRSYVVKEGKVTQYNATHSMGGGTAGNRSVAGFMIGGSDKAHYP